MTKKKVVKAKCASKCVGICVVATIATMVAVVIPCVTTTRRGIAKVTDTDGKIRRMMARKCAIVVAVTPAVASFNSFIHCTGDFFQDFPHFYNHSKQTKI